ncbi:MAG: hypothetical protein HY890_06275 [Deltaproteobacteria bacterium]|nr:hypothetical protein [Deltaproteobacteria bacterium]
MSTFWSRVKEDLKKAAQEGWDVVKEGAKVTAEKSEAVAKVVKLRYDVHKCHKRAEKLFCDLGGAVYDMAKPPYENPLSKPDVTRLVEEIKGIEAEAAKLKAEIEAIRKKEPAKV